MIDLTPGLIARATGSSFQGALLCAPALSEAMRLYAINTPARAGMFLANIGHETMGLIHFAEVWGPTSQQLRYERDFTAPWPTSPAQARLPAFERNRLAYGLGNVNPGDGRLFRGHGMLHNTGRHNHARARDRLRKKLPVPIVVPDFELQPHKLMDPYWGAYAAADYVEMTDCNAMADAGDFDGYCDRVNFGRKTDREGDSNGFAHRLALWRGIEYGRAFA